MSRRRRIRIALFASLCLLFQQVALAAYLCPVEPAEKTSPAEHCAALADAASGRNDPSLCHKHCAPDRAVAADHAGLGVPAPALPPPLFALVLAQPVSHVAVQAIMPIERPDPPLRLRYCSFLI